MPRINAATVAEHRAHQRRALLDAAREALLDGGYPALSFSELARRTGLARPTVYSYFQTKEEIVVALCEIELPRVGAETDQAVARANGPREQLAAFVRAQLRAARDRRYRIAHALVDAPLSDQTRRTIMALHHELMPSAVPIFTELGHPDPAIAAALLQGLINAAVTAMDAGESPRRIAQSTIDAALSGLANPGATPSPARPGGRRPAGR
jgi:AcrR family transcriptional regulator